MIVAAAPSALDGGPRMNREPSPPPLSAAAPVAHMQFKSPGKPPDLESKSASFLPPIGGNERGTAKESGLARTAKGGKGGKGRVEHDRAHATKSLMPSFRGELSLAPRKRAVESVLIPATGQTSSPTRPHAPGTLHRSHPDVYAPGRSHSFVALANTRQPSSRQSRASMSSSVTSPFASRPVSLHEFQVEGDDPAEDHAGGENEQQGAISKSSPPNNSVHNSKPQDTSDSSTLPPLIDFPKIIQLFRARHTCLLHDRHAAILAKLRRVYLEAPSLSTSHSLQSQIAKTPGRPPLEDAPRLGEVLECIREAAYPTPEEERKRQLTVVTLGDPVKLREGLLQVLEQAALLVQVCGTIPTIPLASGQTFPLSTSPDTLLSPLISTLTSLAFVSCTHSYAPSLAPSLPLAHASLLALHRLFHPPVPPAPRTVHTVTSALTGDEGRGRAQVVARVMGKRPLLVEVGPSHEEEGGWAVEAGREGPALPTLVELVSYLVAPDTSAYDAVPPRHTELLSIALQCIHKLIVAGRLTARAVNETPVVPLLARILHPTCSFSTLFTRTTAADILWHLLDSSDSLPLHAMAAVPYHTSTSLGTVTVAGAVAQQLLLPYPPDSATEPPQTIEVPAAGIRDLLADYFSRHVKLSPPERHLRNDIIALIARLAAVESGAHILGMVATGFGACVAGAVCGARFWIGASANGAAVDKLEISEEDCTMEMIAERDFGDDENSVSTNPHASGRVRFAPRRATVPTTMIFSGSSSRLTGGLFEGGLAAMQPAMDGGKHSRDDMEMVRGLLGVVGKLSGNGVYDLPAALLTLLTHLSTLNDPHALSYTPRDLRTIHLCILSLISRLPPAQGTGVALVDFLRYVKERDIVVVDGDPPGIVVESGGRACVALCERGGDVLRREMVEDGVLNVAAAILGTSAFHSGTHAVFLLFVSLLCTDSPAYRLAAGQSDVLRFARTLLTFTGPDPKKRDFVIMSAVRCVWEGVCGCWENEVAFLEQGGLFDLLRLIEIHSHLRPPLLGCLSDLLENPRARAHLLEWRTERDVKRGAVSMLLEIWESEERMLDMREGNRGPIEEKKESLKNRSLDQMPSDWFPGFDTAAASPAAIAELSTNVCSKVYSVLSKLAFESLESSTPLLTPPERIKLHSVCKYLDFKIGEVWREIAVELEEEEVRPVTPDRECLEVALEVTEVKRAAVKERQAEVLRKQEDHDHEGEVEFMEEFKQQQLLLRQAEENAVRGSWHTPHQSLIAPDPFERTTEVERVVKSREVEIFVDDDEMAPHTKKVLHKNVQEQRYRQYIFDEESHSDG
ncbi:hypothetical protein HDU93_008120 [Gonapodya sp. JEL0774]|nr:hypothetical protein HDU93_008120 [Gonapodya sp. JEL0774]